MAHMAAAAAAAHITDLPDETLLEIASFLPLRDVLQLRIVCVRLRNICSDPHLLRKFVQTAAFACAPLHSDVNWLRLVQAELDCTERRDGPTGSAQPRQIYHWHPHLNGEARCVYFDEMSGTIVSGDVTGSLVALDVARLDQLGTESERHPREELWRKRESCSVYALELLHGRTLVYGTDQGHLVLADLRTGQEWWRWGGRADDHTAYVSQIRQRADGHQLATCSGDHTVRLWDTATGRLLSVLHGHTDWVRSLLVAGDLLVTGAKDSSIRVWDPRASPACQHTLRSALFEDLSVWALAQWPGEPVHVSRRFYAGTGAARGPRNRIHEGTDAGAAAAAVAAGRWGDGSERPGTCRPARHGRSGAGAGAGREPESSSGHLVLPGCLWGVSGRLIVPRGLYVGGGRWMDDAQGGGACGFPRYRCSAGAVFVCDAVFFVRPSDPSMMYRLGLGDDSLGMHASHSALLCASHAPARRGGVYVLDYAPPGRFEHCTALRRLSPQQARLGPVLAADDSDDL